MVCRLPAFIHLYSQRGQLPLRAYAIILMSSSGLPGIKCVLTSYCSDMLLMMIDAYDGRRAYIGARPHKFTVVAICIIWMYVYLVQALQMNKVRVELHCNIAYAVLAANIYIGASIKHQ